MASLIKYFVLGVFFGIVLTKGEIVSWFRIQEMFRFHSFHMYGVIGSAVGLGIICIQIIKRRGLHGLYGKPMTVVPKPGGFYNYLIGGTIFGMGWALIGACPGPMFILLGNGYLQILIAFAGALAGAYVYGLIRAKLPH